MNFGPLKRGDFNYDNYKKVLDIFSFSVKMDARSKLTEKIGVREVYISRHMEKTIEQTFKAFPAVLVTGSLQVGKSTLLAN